MPHEAIVGRLTDRNPTVATSQGIPAGVSGAYRGVPAMARHGSDTTLPDRTNLAPTAERPRVSRP